MFHLYFTWWKQRTIHESDLFVLRCVEVWSWFIIFLFFIIFIPRFCVGVLEKRHILAQRWAPRIRKNTVINLLYRDILQHNTTILLITLKFLTYGFHLRTSFLNGLQLFRSYCNDWLCNSWSWAIILFLLQILSDFIMHITKMFDTD